MNINRDRQMEDQIVQQLEAEQDHLDPMIRSRLDHARRRALAGATTTKNSSIWPWLATAGATGLALLVIIQLDQPGLTQPPPSLDLDLLTMSEFDLLDQDLEFMTWLADQDPDLPVQDEKLTPGGSS